MATTKKLKQTVTITRNENEPETMELIADSIIKISNAFEAIEKSRLSQRVIVLLIKDYCKGGISLSDIERVLETVPKLKLFYTKKSV